MGIIKKQKRLNRSVLLVIFIISLVIISLIITSLILYKRDRLDFIIGNIGEVPGEDDNIDDKNEDNEVVLSPLQIELGDENDDPETDQQDQRILELEQRIEELEDSSSNTEGRSNYSSDEKQGISAEEIDPYLTGVVKIDCENQEGSGTLWKSGGKNYILTNYHVVSNAYPPGHCNVIVHEKNSTNGLGLYEVYPSTGRRWNSYTDVSLLEIVTSSMKDMNFLPIEDLNYDISFLRLCSSQMSLGSPVIVIGYPAFSLSPIMWQGEKKGEQTIRTITNGIISSYDSSEVKPYGSLPYPDYFVSAKIDSGNSGGIAFSKDQSGLCVLGIPTWLSLGEYESQGIVQNINNVLYTGN